MVPAEGILRVVLARDADVINNAEHAARLQRVEYALRELQAGASPAGLL